MSGFSSLLDQFKQATRDSAAATASCRLRAHPSSPSSSARPPNDSKRPRLLPPPPSSGTRDDGDDEHHARRAGEGGSSREEGHPSPRSSISRRDVGVEARERTGAEARGGGILKTEPRCRPMGVATREPGPRAGLPRGVGSGGPHAPPDGDGRGEEEIIAGSGEQAAFSRGVG